MNEVKETEELCIKIDDLYGLHKPYTLKFKPGYTCLIGPNGSGKTTLIHQLKEYAEENKYDVVTFNNITDGGGNSIGTEIAYGRMSKAANLIFSSEGQRNCINLGKVFRDVGGAVTNAVATRKPLFVLIDAIDSGTDISNLREFRSGFKIISEDTKGLPVYIIVSANAYEMAKEADCINVKTGKHITFKTYEYYSKYICALANKND